MSQIEVRSIVDAVEKKEKKEKGEEREKGDDMWSQPPHVIHVSETAIQNQ